MLNFTCVDVDCNREGQEPVQGGLGRVATRQCDISIERFRDVTAAILVFQKGDLAAFGRL